MFVAMTLYNILATFIGRLALTIIEPYDIHWCTTIIAVIFSFTHRLTNRNIALPAARFALITFYASSFWIGGFLAMLFTQV